MSGALRRKRHVLNTWTFGYGTSELRVEESPRANISGVEARSIAQAIRDSQGTLCVDCHKAARFRIVHVSDPTRPRCWDCDQIATQIYAQKE